MSYVEYSVFNLYKDSILFLEVYYKRFENNSFSRHLLLYLLPNQIIELTFA